MRGLTQTPVPASPPQQFEWRKLRSGVFQYVFPLGMIALVSETVHWTSLESPWSGLISLGAVLVCAWQGGAGPALCIPPFLLVLSRLHPDHPRDSAWPTSQEFVALGVITLVSVSVGLAGGYRRRIVAVSKEHAQRLRDQSRALGQAHIVFRDIAGRVTEWSAGATALFGWTSNEVQGRNLHELLRTGFSIPLPEIQAELLARGEWQGEVLQHHRLGHTLNVIVHWILYRDPHGQPIGVAEVHNDITELRRVEAIIRDADRRKDEFLATLAHELRNPLAPIRNSLQLLQLSAELPPALQDVRRIMEEQVGHLTRLVDDLLDVSRVTHGKIELLREPAALNRLVTAAVEIVRSQIEERQHSLHIALPDEAVWLEVDPVRITQVIANLLGNAAKYTDPGGDIWLTAQVRNDTLLLSVRDNGVGIPENMLHEIFHIFSQVDHSITRSQGGLGIGLTLVKSLIELHGGTIHASSAGLGQGSEFCVQLTVAPATVGEGLKPMPASATGHPESELPRRRILVVDDTRAAGFILSKLLEKLGQQVQIANSGASALQLMSTDRPDIVFSDIAMPHMDGYELAQRIRTNPELQSTVLVAVTGFGQQDDRDRALNAGFTHHMVKPASLTDIHRILVSTSKTVESP